MNDYTRRLRSVPFIYHLIEKAVKNNIITNPDEIREGIDVSSSFQNNDPNSPNYFLNRGFPEEISTTFERSIVPWHPVGFDHVRYPHTDFLNLIRNVMWLSENEMEWKYPKAKHPLLRQRLEIVHEHFLNNYDINLKDM